MLNPVAVAFAAGSAGGLATVFTLWLFVLLGITAGFGVELQSPMRADLYRMVVWGGIFGFLFLLPVMRGSVWQRGLIFGLAPSAVQCLIVFPYALGAGMLGMGLGELTPVFVLIFNTVWGLVTAYLFVNAGGDTAAAGSHA
ncbi:MAG: hypothetical protein ACREVE_15020 [Gammaproteobacteria bacterium]